LISGYCDIGVFCNASNPSITVMILITIATIGLLTKNSPIKDVSKLFFYKKSKVRKL
jgi:hypothetical protein